MDKEVASPLELPPSVASSTAPAKEMMIRKKDVL
jgi:hypothetical protein